MKLTRGDRESAWILCPAEFLEKMPFWDRLERLCEACPWVQQLLGQAFGARHLMVGMAVAPYTARPALLAQRASTLPQAGWE